MAHMLDSGMADMMAAEILGCLDYSWDQMLVHEMEDIIAASMVRNLDCM